MGKGKKKLFGWYETTWNRVYTRTEAGNRFNAMKGLAIVACKCNISEERFEHDLYKLSTLWQERIWKGADPFNTDNIEAIMRMFRNGERYRKTKRETLEGYFGWKWSGKSKRRKKPLKREDHVKVMNTFRDIKYPDGEWRNKNGAPTALNKVQEWRENNPDGKKADCIRETGLSKPTVYKWWDGAPAAAPSVQKPKKKTSAPQATSEKTFDWKATLADAVGLPVEDAMKLLEKLREEAEKEKEKTNSDT